MDGIGDSENGLLRLWPGMFSVDLDRYNTDNASYAQGYAEGKLNKVWNYYYDSVKDEAWERDGDIPDGWQE